MFSSSIIGAYSGYLAEFGYGNHDDASFSISKKLSLKEGNNTLDILSMMIGVQVQYQFHWTIYPLAGTEIFQ